MANGYVVQRGTIGGEYARGSIIPEGHFEQERVDHWVAKGVIRRATDEDVEAAKGIQPSGSILDTGSRTEVLTPEEQAAQNRAAREAEITGLEARLEQLRKEHEEVTAREESIAAEQTAAMKAAQERLGQAPDDKDPRAPHRGNESPESTQSSLDDPTPHDAKETPDPNSEPPAPPSGRSGTRIGR